MWKFDNRGARLIGTPSKGFRKTTQDNLTLICPRRDMFDWSPDERFLRSVVIDKDGYVVSCGWPKFGNYGEFFEDTDALNRELKSGGTVRFTHKEDGSLCIRSVVGGNVILRTRGTIDGGVERDDQVSYKERVFNVAAEKYPMLLNPKWLPNQSLLFEYVSPDNLIVVKYKNPDLIFIGLVSHINFRLGSWTELEHISQEANLNLVRIYQLPRDPMEILDVIKDWDEEGIVVRCCDDQVMVKIKSARYLAQHRMRYSINYKFMVEFCELSKINSEEEFIEEIRKCGYDFEIAQVSIPFFHRYKKVNDHVTELISEAKLVVDEFKSKPRTPEVRKELAKMVNKYRSRRFIFPLYDEKFDRINNIRRKMIINEELLEG